MKKNRKIKYTLVFWTLFSLFIVAGFGLGKMTNAAPLEGDINTIDVSNAPVGGDTQDQTSAASKQTTIGGDTQDQTSAASKQTTIGGDTQDQTSATSKEPNISPGNTSTPAASPTTNPTTTTPAATSATASSATGLVPCGTASTPCTLCHLITGISNVVKWGLGILITVALVAIAIAGMMYVVSTGSEKMMTAAKSFLGSALIGFAVVLGAYLIVAVTMSLISAQSSLGISGKTGANFSAATISYSCDQTSNALTGASNTAGTNPAGTNPAGTNTAAQQAQNQTDCANYYNATNAGADNSADIAKCAADKNNQQAAANNNANTGTGNNSVVSAAQQAKANGCQYSQGSRNDCTGDPAYTDCGQLACDSMKAAGQNIGNCSSINTKTLYSEAQAVGDSSTLKAGDVLVRNDGSSGHAAICENDGCTTITHAAGVNKGIVTGANNYLLKQDNVKVIRASS